MTNGDDIIRFEEKNPDLQMKFLESIGLVNATEVLQVKKLESQEYWDFVEEQYNE